MLEKLITGFNKYRPTGLLTSPLFHSSKKYAFVGAGSHSLANLYPILRYFNIDLKYIYSKKRNWSKDLSRLFPKAVYTHSLEDICRDGEVSGVFVSATASSHKDILTTLFTAQKNVFIEKPPCGNLEELQGLININGDLICKIGLQRRYWPGNKYILRKKDQAISYIYQFRTGPYLQGDVWTELFIHPLDYCHFLFGDFSVNSATLQEGNGGITAQLHITHENKVSGLLDLSTQYSWNPAEENLLLNCKTEELAIQYPGYIKGTQKPLRILNIPAERLLNQPRITKEYFSRGNSIVPAPEFNNLILQGFYKEIEAFILLVENGLKGGEPASDLTSLLSIYKAIKQIR